MPISYLLDTNTASFLIRGKPPVVLDRLARATVSQTAISAVTEAELLFGLERKPEAVQLRKVATLFLQRAIILPWTSKAAKSYSHLRAMLESRGKPLSALDTMIVAHALSEELVLVSNDQAFDKFQISS